MDRQFTYDGAIPQALDVLLTNKDAYIAIAKLAGAVLGTSTILNGFTCVPVSPPGMQVIVSAGEIYALEEIDPTAYGDAGADTTDLIVKQGIILTSTTLNITAPGTSGYSQNYLVEFQFEQIDGAAEVLPYYNASDPTSPFSGPGNSGASNNTVRFNTVGIQTKAGTAAPTGTQTTPSPDSGYVGGFVVTVANGQTSINSGNITTYASASFINETLIQKISQTTADARYAQQTQVQNSAFITGTDTGTANTLVVSLSPAITSYVYGMSFNILAANSNTGATTININGLGVKNIVNPDGSALIANELLAGGEYNIVYNGTAFQLMNPYFQLPAVISSVIPNSSAISISNNVAFNVTNISVPKGTWDIYGNAFVNVSSSLMISFYAWCSSVSATRPDNSLCSLVSGSTVSPCLGSNSLNTPFLRVTLASTTTFYLSGVVNFPGGPYTVCGAIRAVPVPTF